MKFVDNPDEFNNDISAARFNGGGCIGSRACTKCGCINSGTCLCIGIFTCINCKYNNEPAYIKQVREIKLTKIVLPINNNWKYVEE